MPFYRVTLGFRTGLDFTWFYEASLYYIRFYLTGFYLTGFDWVLFGLLLDFTGIYRTILDLTGFFLFIIEF